MKKLDLNKQKAAFTGAMKVTVLLIICGLACTGCDKEDNPGIKTGTIKYESSTYTVSIGEIGSDKNGYTSVELLGNLDNVAQIRKGQMIVVIGMKIEVGGKTLAYTSCDVSSGSLVYYFGTKDKPDKIIVYSEDSSSAQLTFSGKNKSLTE
jgi:hypothetical protein